MTDRRARGTDRASRAAGGGPRYPSRARRVPAGPGPRPGPRPGPGRGHRERPGPGRADLRAPGPARPSASGA